jgi:hypothetical protein
MSELNYADDDELFEEETIDEQELEVEDIDSDDDVDLDLLEANDKSDIVDALKRIRERKK